MSNPYFPTTNPRRVQSRRRMQRAYTVSEVLVCDGFSNHEVWDGVMDMRPRSRLFRRNIYSLTYLPRTPRSCLRGLTMRTTVAEWNKLRRCHIFYSELIEEVTHGR